MYKFTGDFSVLEQLGFVCNASHNYYYLPRGCKDKFYNPINVDIKTRRVEYTDKKDLKLIENYIKRIV